MVCCLGHERLCPAGQHTPGMTFHVVLCRARGVTIEYQRAQAKAMQQYFRELNAQKAAEKAQCGS